MSLLRGIETGFVPPVVPINPPILGIMKQRGIFWPEAHRNARLMGELSSACQEILGFNAVNVPFDMTVEAEALGCETVWKAGITSTPQIKERTAEDQGLLDFDGDILRRGRFPAVFEALAMLRERYAKRIPVISFAEGPFTLSCLAMGLNRMYRYVIKDPEKTAFVVDRMGELLTLYVERQLDAGADAAIVLDPNVMGLTKTQFRQFVLPVYKKITARVRGPLILHICGDTKKILDSIPESGFAAFSFEYPSVELADVKKSLGGKMRIVGSVPTVTHLLNGNREDVIAVSQRMLEGGVDLLAPSCFTPPETPLENVRAMRVAIDIWKRKEDGV
jgi:[methyl-Co(III) methanol-specific corrinoid protein]:coenzyme M methyltransferase